MARNEIDPGRAERARNALGRTVHSFTWGTRARIQRGRFTPEWHKIIEFVIQSGIGELCSGAQDARVGDELEEYVTRHVVGEQDMPWCSAVQWWWAI